jgi:hypothetical protein|tara:strand:+ start:135 stop:263 length:129 start_codon:yes stop_codon:yes gene_type:complete
MALEYAPVTQKATQKAETETDYESEVDESDIEELFGHYERVN